MRHPLLLAFVVLAGLMLLGLDHGLPHRYVPDDHAVRCALGIARDLGDGELSKLEAIVPPSGRYTTYPYLLPYVDLAAIGVRFAVGRALGEWGGAGEFAERLFEDATGAWWPSRLAMALITLLVLTWSTWRIAREVSLGRAQAGLAALLAGSSLLVVQYAHTTRPWAALTAFGALTLALSLRLRRRDGVVVAGAAFVAAALGAATHQVGALFFGLPLLACLMHRRWKGLLFGLVPGGLVALLVGYPFLLVHGGDAARGAIAGSDTDALQLGGQAFDLSMIGGARLVETASSWLAYDPVLVLVGTLGLLGLAFGRFGRHALLIVVPTLLFMLLFLFYDGTHVRYLMPAVPGLAVGAAATLVALARRGGIARGLAIVLVSLPVIQAARLDMLLMRQDTRTIAAARIPQLIDAQAVVAIDHVGSLYGPPARPTAASLAVWIEDGLALGARGAVLAPSRTEQRWLALGEAGVPDPPGARTIVPISRFYLYDSYYPTDYLLADEPRSFDDVLRAHGVTHYVQVDRLPDEARRQPITDLMATRGRLVHEVSPTGASAPARAELPTDLGCAWLDLWRYERPGPWIRVWELDG